MAEPKKLHGEWQAFKTGMGAAMIKDAGLKFNGNLGPNLDALEDNWGKPAGQKAADEIKKIVPKYKALLNNAKPQKGAMSKIGAQGVDTSNAYAAQKKKGETIL